MPQARVIPSKFHGKIYILSVGATALEVAAPTGFSSPFYPEAARKCSVLLGR